MARENQTTCMVKKCEVETDGKICDKHLRQMRAVNEDTDCMKESEAMYEAETDPRKWEAR